MIMVKAEVIKQRVVIRRQLTLTIGMVGAQVAFRFDREWDGLAKIAVFRQGDVVRDAPNITDVATIPSECLMVPGEPLWIGVYGAKPDGTVVIPTIESETDPVMPGSDPSGDPGTDPALPVWQQALNAAANPPTISDHGTWLIFDAINGVYVDSGINAVGSGGGGAGNPGEDGATFIPAVSPEGVISWSNDRGLENPEPMDIKGPKGEKGDKGDPGNPGEPGAKGEKGDPGEKGDTGAQGPKGDTGETGSQGPKGDKGNPGYTPQKGVDYFDGKDGKPGNDGQDGVSPVVSIEDITGGHRITITDVSGTKTVDVLDGADGKNGIDGKNGEPGKDGQDGTSATHSWNGTVLTVTSASGTSSADLKGAKGDKGDTGSQGIPGEKGDKGDTGTTGSKGADGKTPVKGVDYFTEADKAEMVEAVLESMDGIPSYWQTALDDGVEAINTALCEAGRNKSAFLFYTDAHWNYGSQMSPTLLKYLYKHTGMTRTFFGGDIVNNEADDYDTMAYLWEWRKQLKDLPNHHSVVGNHDDGNTTNNLFSEQYVYGYLLSAEESPDMVMGDGIYYYVDSPAEKTRYLCLDTAYKGVDSKQQEFVKNALLTTPGGWHIVAISHIWHDTNYNVTPPVPGTINSGASTLLSMFEAYNSRNGDYADCTGWVEFCIGGHTHWDYDSTSALGIPIILVETDSQHIRSGLTFAAGTTTEASVNGIVADYDAKTVKVVRIGRGASREVEMTWYEVSYTNVISTATDTDGVTIYNGIGYKGNTRMSGSSGAFRDNTGSCCTGYIKIPESGTITVRMKNIVNNTFDNYGCGFYFFNGTGVACTDNVGDASNLAAYYNPVYDENGNVIEITKTNEKEWTHMVISAVTIDATSVITINEPIE